MPHAALRPSSLAADIDRAAAELTPQLIAWRRDLHAHPELGNREFRTAQVVADHLRSLGMDEVRTEVAHTGVVALLKGGKPGPVVALRADMDALPVAEQVDVPFASKVRTEYNGEQVGVMHACGHDTHTAILMTVASVLAGLRARLCGTVKFIFQPAEEGPPEGERGGAELMIAEGALANPEVDAIFGLHVTSLLPSQVIGVRGGPLMASADQFRIQVRGRQTHGSAPWRGVDPIVTAAQVVMGLQTIVSRQIDVTHEPAVVTIGAIKGGVRDNIIPDEVQMIGTIRTFDEPMREQIHERVRATAEGIAKSARADCEVCIKRGYDVTVNDTQLTALMRPTLERVAGPGRLPPMPKVTGSEDFSCFQQQVPGMFFFVGVTPPDKDAGTAEPNHSPRFYVDEAALPLGVRALAHLTCDYLEAPAQVRRLE
ncbi:MAG: amidohydrolase [Betaproteobacteria bacterium]|nr:amidohydrolase [Betaproteobacteria bacterium]MCC6249934.1 amidohydrolase [Rubrivivax sp.]